MAKQEISDEKREHLKRIGAQPGECRNPTGRNGWTAMRERYRIKLDEKLDTLTDVLLDCAEKGDVQALRLALGAIVDVKRVELTGDDGAPIDFVSLAARARRKDDADEP